MKNLDNRTIIDKEDIKKYLNKFERNLFKALINKIEKRKNVKNSKIKHLDSKPNESNILDDFRFVFPPFNQNEYKYSNDKYSKNKRRTEKLLRLFGYM